jgi:hypothetical protein
MARLITLPQQPNPNPCGWLVSQGPDANCTPLEHRAALRAFLDVGTLEVPLGSNRGIRIDNYARRGGLPVVKDPTTKEGWWWCGLAMGAWLADAGSQVPQDYADCDAWVPFLVAEPRTVCAVVYGTRKGGVASAHHIGLRVRAAPMVLTIEGNRGFAGTTNNGVAVDIGPMVRTDVLGYFYLRAE